MRKDTPEQIKKGICSKCNGKRTIKVKEKKKKCPACNGTGLLLDKNLLTLPFGGGS